MRETSRAADKKPRVNNNQKTRMGAGITYAHGKQLGYNAIIMCPAHLVYKWSREIEDSVPNARCVVVSTVADINELSEAILNSHKKENLYLIMSYNSAKTKYYEMPCPLYSESKQAYVCPKCGQVLTYTRKIKTGHGRRTVEEVVNLTHEDFTKPGKYNMVCNNKIEVYNPKTNKKEVQECKEALWRPVTSEEEVGDWIKLGKYGWYKISRIPALAEDMRTRLRSLKPDEIALYTKFNEVTEMVRNTPDKLKIRALIKYPLALYIKRRFKKKIDYVIFDEMHKLSSQDTQQGAAMGHLAQASKNVIGLTGTLINGYADSLFPILYRLVPRTMRLSRPAQPNGYKFEQDQVFLRDYGSAKTTVDENNKRKSNHLPGISPLLFTDYLMDICGFITLDDVAEGLPSYAEIPLGVEMDSAVAAEYDNIRESFKAHAGFRGDHKKATTSYIQLLHTYPDMPYGQAPIIDPEDNSVVFTPNSVTDFIDNKLDQTLELTTQKIAAGEKVLIYYTWTNITDVEDKLKEQLTGRGYKVAILKTGRGITAEMGEKGVVEKGEPVKTEQREAWVERQIQEENVDVLICNPVLVETGLDLLAFTTIIWYQMTDSIATLRQASRRSWRLGQLHDIEVYFLYYYNTTQEDLLALMGTKLQASMIAEGRSSDEGLSALSQNDDLATQITNSVMKGVSNKVNVSSFNVSKKVRNAEKIEMHTENRYRISRDRLRYRKPFVARWFKFKIEEPRQAKSESGIFNLLDQDLINILA